MVGAIHQFVAGFSTGDAISNEALRLRTVFRDWGYTSDIFCEQRRITPELRREARDVLDYNPVCRPGDVVLLHLSVGSPVNEIFAGLKCRKALLYHNITPPEFFKVLSPYTAHWLSLGMKQARALAGMAQVNLADSRYNAQELEQMGYATPAVFPLFLDLPPDPPPRRTPAGRGRDGKVTVLFVGRCVPNKKIEDLIMAFAWFQRYVEPASRLVHIGSFVGMERYHHLLLSLVRDLRLNDVLLAGMLPQRLLQQYYSEADLFLCLSEHEGFCIPLLEAMRNDIPVLGYASAAVPETMDGAGILLHQKDFAFVAETMGAVVVNGPMRRAIVAEQRVRVERYQRRDLNAELRKHLAPLLSAP